MKYFTVKELENKTKNILENLSSIEDVCITKNGKPSALLIDVSQDNLEETIQAIRQAKAMLAFDSMRKKAISIGFMDEEEIENEIKEARN